MAGLVKPGDPGFYDTFEDMAKAVPILRLNADSIAGLSPGEAARAQALLAEYRGHLDSNPLLGYLPAGPKHFAFHGSDSKTRAIFGGNRAGKTTTAVVDDLIQMTPAELLPAHLRQFKQHSCPFYVRLMAPDMKRTMVPVIHEKLRQWTPKSLMKGGSFDKAYSKTDEVLRLECGCRFDFLSYEMDLDKFGGAALHRCHYDEEPPEDIRNECLWRLVDFGGDELFSMTPLKGMSWMYRKIYKRDGEKLPSGRDRVRRWTIGIRDNRMLSPDEIDAAIAELDNPAERRQREFGEFAERGGPVYPNFMEARCPDVTKEQLAGMDVVVGIDPGLRWAGFVWIAYDRDNYALIFDSVKLEGERFENGVNPGHYVALIREKEKQWGLTKPHYVVDPAMRIRSLVNSESVQSELQRLGLPVMVGQNDVEAGVSHIRRRLSSGSLKICERNSQLFDEAIEYSAEERDDGVFQVVKRNDHLLDAMRYAIMERPWMPPKRQTRVDMGNVATGPPRRPARGYNPSVMGEMV